MDFSRGHVQKKLTFRQIDELMAKRAQRNRVDSSSTGGPTSAEVSSNVPASYDVSPNSDVVGVEQEDLNQVVSGEGVSCYGGSSRSGSARGGSQRGSSGWGG